MNTRKIGKITSVDSFRIVVELDENLKSLFKSGFHDIYEIARINSYIIIPVGSDRIVAIVTRVKIQDETEIEKTSGSISLPKSKRYLVATMIGTIQGGTDLESSYLQGVYNYPVLDNPVWYVTKDDLDKIFDTTNATDVINFDSNYFLPIGTSPAFTDYKIKINPDKFFGKHAAILGNTGSGKSCTVASIVQSLFRFKFKTTNGESNLKNAHFIIFDTNGEYKKAFGLDKDSAYKEKSIVNSFYIDKEGLKAPYWFMNFDDFDYLFEPSAGTQVPILKNALGLAKERCAQANHATIDSYVEKGITILLDASPDDLKKKKCLQKFGNWEWQENNTIKQLSEAISSETNSLTLEMKSILVALSKNISISDETIKVAQLKAKYEEYLQLKSVGKIIQEKNIDLPIYFSFEDLLSKHFDNAIDQIEQSNAKLREYASTLKLRMQSYLNDERIASPLLLKNKEKLENSLMKFLAFILGDFYRFFQGTDTDIYSTYYKKQEYLIQKQVSQITIIDMSLLPYEVLETITGLIGRMVLDFSSRINPRGEYPLVIILEEAQNYIPETNRKDRTSISKKVFERIAREGRKYGVSLVVSSQRPSELSKTVLSQCNSFIIHRLQNPEDQKYVRQLVSSANEDILSQLPILPQQHAIIMGDAVRTPVQVKLNTANPKPDSENPKFIEKWLKDITKEVPNYIEITKDWEGVRKPDADK